MAIMITEDGKPDLARMSLLISAIQKLVIKDVVRYADRKIRAYKSAVSAPAKNEIYR